MCGIAGFTIPGREAEAVLALMTRALVHCGPDGNGTFVDDRIALGHTRLAIIDLAGGVLPGSTGRPATLSSSMARSTATGRLPMNCAAPVSCTVTAPIPRCCSS